MSPRWSWPGVIEAYRDRLPVSERTPVVTLFEGNTPLVPAPELSQRTGCEVYLKVEGANPTGSFKDRGMTVAISKAAEEGAKAVICASTGNTSASAAAYAVRAGMTCAVLVPQGKIALGKMAQALVHGAKLLQVDGNFDDCLELARKLAVDYPVALVNSVNPYRLEGQKTAAFEICDDLGRAPDVLALPYGGGGNTTAYAKALAELGLDTPIYSVEASDRARTLASAIQITEPAHRDRVEASGADVRAVSDEEIVAAWLELAREEGLFCEPSSAAGLAFLRGTEELRGARVVVTVTGHGLKDPGAADFHAPAPLVVDPDPDAIVRAAG
jgi:threonine synthase